MSYEVTVHDLPDEMLEKILLLLSLEDRKSALPVCKRWSVLKLIDLSAVQLVVDTERFEEHDYQDYRRALLASSRQYKHILCVCGIWKFPISDFHENDLLLDILRHFSRSVESLTLKLSFYYNPPTSLILLAKNTALLSNLKHLRIVGNTFQSARGSLRLMKFSRMSNLEGLYGYDDLMLPNMQDITPNITRLHMVISSKESLNFLRHFSSQLVELEATIKPHANFLTVCRMRFPLLEKVSLKFSCIHADILWFIHRLPGIPALCQSLKNVRFLHLEPLDYSGNLDPDSLRAICTLKFLKSLHLSYFDINVPTELNFSPLESLQVLSLTTVRFFDQVAIHRFCQYAFPCLAVFEMKDMQPPSMSRNHDLSFKLYDSLSSNMPSLKRLVLVEPNGDLQLGPFLEFCASQGPRMLRIRCRHVFDTNPVDELRPIWVETLTIDLDLHGYETSLESLPRLLLKLLKSMGELKRLELTFRSKDSRDLYVMHPETIRSLRDAFPRCEIVERLKVQIEEQW